MTDRILFGLIPLLAFNLVGDVSGQGNLYNSNATFPQVFLFRNDRLITQLNEKDLNAYLNRLDGSLHKMASEEIVGLPAAEIQEVYRKLNEDHPEKLYLLHYNGEAIAVQHHQRRGDDEYYAQQVDEYFPGHWAFREGAVLEKDIGPDERTLEVSDASLFKVKDYIYYAARQRGEDVSFPTDLLIISLNKNGRRMWDYAEYATLESLGNGEIVVRRGRYGSAAKSFRAKRTMILPIKGCSWANNAMWYFNFSADCPRNAKGEQAADIYVRNLVELMKSDEYSFLDGIGFDVLYFSAHSDIDADNDNVADGGYTDGVNRWRIGNVKMLEHLRSELGPEAILTADSHHATNQRGVGILNGMESEGLVSHNDGYRAISTTINVHRYWQQFGCEPRFSYIVDKLKHDSDSEQGEKLEKLAQGMASVLGVGIGMLDVRQYLQEKKYHYLVNPDSNQSGWLGKPVADLKSIRLNTISYAADDAWVKSASVLNGQLHPVSKGEWLVVNDDQGISKSVSGYEEGNAARVGRGTALKNIILEFKALDLSQGLILKMDLKSEQALAGLERHPQIPRFVTAELSKEVQYSTNRLLNEQYRNCQGVMGASGWHTNLFYFRANSAEQAKLNLEFEGLGDFRIRNVEIMSGPLVLAREFEHGAVIVNLAEKAVSMPIYNKLEDVETGRRVNGQIQLEALDARFLLKK